MQKILPTDFMAIFPWSVAHGGPLAKRFQLREDGNWDCSHQVHHGWILSAQRMSTGKVLDLYKEAIEVFVKLEEREDGKIVTPFLFGLTDFESMLDAIAKERALLAENKSQTKKLVNEDIVYL